MYRVMGEPPRSPARPHSVRSPASTRLAARASRPLDECSAPDATRRWDRPRRPPAAWPRRPTLDQPRMTGNEIRTRFLEHFASREHLVLPSAPLVPQGDPSTLFISAGMQPPQAHYPGFSPPAAATVAGLPKWPP